MRLLIVILLTIPTTIFASHFEIPKPRPVQMIIANESLRLFGDLKSYEQDATEHYFGNKQKINPAELCARFILKELDGSPQKHGQYCTYVPVYSVLHKKKLITTLYELNLVADSNGTDPHKLIEQLCQRYTKEKQATDEKRS